MSYMTILLTRLSSSLMLLPVGVTLAVYAGIQTQQIVNAIHGKIPPGAITSLGPNGNPMPAPIIATTMYCQKETAVEAFPYRYICQFTPIPSNLVFLFGFSWLAYFLVYFSSHFI